MTSNNGVSVKPRDHRHTCGRLLFRGRLPWPAYVEIRCPKCGQMYVATGKTSAINLDKMQTVAIE